MSKHTPGPWYVQSQNGKVIAIGSSLETVALVNAPIENARLIAEAGTVATETGMTPRQLVENRDYWKSCSHGFVLQRDEARAQRAELLAALKAVEESKGTRLLFDVRKKVRAAIAKAKGMDQ